MMTRSGVAPVLFGLFLLAGCMGTGIDGPQIDPIPEGLGYDPNASAARKVFTDRPAIDQRAYFNTTEDHTSITITEYRGGTSEDTARAARDEHESRWGGDRYRYGEVLPVSIDGRDAWGWYEWQATARKYVAVVPYDDATFTVEVFSSESERQDDTLLRDFAKRFSRDPNTWRTATTGIVATLLLGLVVFALVRFTRNPAPDRAPFRCDEHLEHPEPEVPGRDAAPPPRPPNDPPPAHP